MPAKPNSVIKAADAEVQGQAVDLLANLLVQPDASPPLSRRSLLIPRDFMMAPARRGSSSSISPRICKRVFIPCDISDTYAASACGSWQSANRASMTMAR